MTTDDASAPPPEQIGADAQVPLEALDLLILQMLGLAVFAETVGCQDIATSVRAIVDEAVEWRRHIRAGLERPSNEPDRGAR